jgi:hypothetical protein
VSQTGRDQRAVAAGAALPAARDPLLDDAAAQVGVDRATTGALDRLPEAMIGNPVATRIPRHPFGFEDFHAIF